MKFLTVLLIALFGFTASAQETVTDTLGAIIIQPTIKPEFPGGLKTFYAYLSTAIDRNRVSMVGRVKVAFVIEKDGKLTNVNIIQGGGNEIMNDLLKKIFRASPKWKPGILNGEVVRTQHILPIIFN